MTRASTFAGAILAVAMMGAGAAEAAQAEATVARALAASGEPIYQTIDPVGGTSLTVYVARADETLFEARTPRVTVRRLVRGSETTTEVITPTDRLEIAANRARVVLAGRTGSLEARRGDPDSADAVRTAVVRSSAFAEALEALRLVARGTSAPAAHLVLSTRMALAALRGERPLAPLVAPAPVGPPVTMPIVLAVRQDDQSGKLTPGECWDIYAADAIDIYREYEDCVDNEQWWDLVGMASCATIYSLQASGAFSWWLNCTAIRG